jgi:hypothetical protein
VNDEFTSDEELVRDAARVREEHGASSRDGASRVPGGRQAAGRLTQRCHGHDRALLGEACGSWRRGRDNDREKLAAVRRFGSENCERSQRRHISGPEPKRV